MSRHIVFFWVALLALVPTLVLAHKIHIPASTKECFFEDLHENDQVHIMSLTHMSFQPAFPDDRHVSGWGRWSPRYRLLGMVILLRISSSSSSLAAYRPRGKLIDEAHETQHRHNLDNCRQGRSIRVLLFKPDEYGGGQGS